MNPLILPIVQRKKYLEELLVDITHKLKLAPEGKLRVSNDRGIPRYFQITNPKDTRGRYILKKNHDLACHLAQKDYLQKLCQEVREELDDINLYLSKHHDTSLEGVYDSLNAYRKNIVTPMVLSDKMYIQQWETEDYETNPYYPEEKVYTTKKDDLVRSKSEVLLADMYFELGIPYRYEAEVRLHNGKIKYPDFTLLNVNAREVIYHEHLGMMDQDDYRMANFVKLDEYRRNGIYPGKNLIITYEGDGCYLNIKEIKQMIREMYGM